MQGFPSFSHIFYPLRLFNKTKKQKDQDNLVLVFLFARQRPTLAGGVPPTTIGAGELNFRVRDGNGCDLSAIVTEQYVEG